MSPRTIRLRRPAVICEQEGVFVPQADAAMLGEAERRWRMLCESNPAYFDGRLYHVLGVHRNGHGGASAHVIDCAYRYWAVQDKAFDLGVRPLGVKGVIQRDGQYLFGLRSSHVAVYQKMWEFAPGGSVRPGRRPEDVLVEELAEETGLKSVAEPPALAIIFDPVLRCWELVFRLHTADGAVHAPPAEYDELQWARLRDHPEPLSPIARQVAALLRAPAQSESTQ